MALPHKHLPNQGRGGSDALFDRQSQATEHNGNEATCAGATDYVKALAWFGRRVRVDGHHKALLYNQ
jgi:hypothetical protein